MKTALMTWMIILVAIPAFNSNQIFISDITAFSAVLEEWKHPGLYSPVKAFDGNLKSSYAEGNEDGRFGLQIKFNKEFIFDEIQIAAGCFRSEKLYRYNNRVKRLKIYLYDSKNSSNSKTNDGNVFFKNVYTLKDEMRYQSIKINNPGKTKYIALVCYSIYKGTNYNDTCISNIRFLYRGKLILFSNQKKYASKYVTEIGTRLKTILYNKKYSYGERGDLIEVLQNGNIKIVKRSEQSYGKPPTKWKVTNSRLHMKYQGRWHLMQYYITSGGNLVLLKAGRMKIDKMLFPTTK